MTHMQVYFYQCCILIRLLLFPIPRIVRQAANNEQAEAGDAKGDVVGGADVRYLMDCERLLEVLVWR